jgi:methionine synthase II (cobalamin-independent)
LAQLPVHKNVILGIITSKFPELEDKAEMKTRINSAAEIMAKGSGHTQQEALARIGISPQCGFSSHEEGNAINWDDMLNKLKLVKEIADEVWPGQP